MIQTHAHSHPGFGFGRITPSHILSVSGWERPTRVLREVTGVEVRVALGNLQVGPAAECLKQSPGRAFRDGRHTMGSTVTW
ncbi:MAG: hypothetical protein ACREP9_03985 [Candidatus Dormibacteraceae bacterium]